MKRSIATVLAILMLVLPTAFAASDLSGMSVEELIQLKTQIDAELLSRGDLKEFEVPVGVYVIGVDIAAGTYSAEMPVSLRSRSATIYTHKSEAARKRGGYDESYHIEPDRGTEKIGKITLYAGEILEIKYRPVLFKTYTGLGF